jgi:hypothetical protein
MFQNGRIQIRINGFDGLWTVSVLTVLESKIKISFDVGIGAITFTPKGFETHFSNSLLRWSNYVFRWLNFQ